MAGMRHFLSIIAVVALMVGCEETKVASNSPEAKVAIREAANKPTGELTKADLEEGEHAPRKRAEALKACIHGARSGRHQRERGITVPARVVIFLDTRRPWEVL